MHFASVVTEKWGFFVQHVTPFVQGWNRDMHCPAYVLTMLSYSLCSRPKVSLLRARLLVSFHYNQGKWIMQWNKRIMKWKKKDNKMEADFFKQTASFSFLQLHSLLNSQPWCYTLKDSQNLSGWWNAEAGKCKFVFNINPVCSYVMIKCNYLYLWLQSEIYLKEHHVVNTSHSPGPLVW